MSQRYAIFLINLLQDVSIVRPLIYMTSRDLGLFTELYLLPKFIQRDNNAFWQNELNQIRKVTGASILTPVSDMDTLQLLQNKSGFLIAASESNLLPHKPVHDIFRFAPSTFLKITLQHGFECPGFLNNKAHDMAYGNNITFAADVICGWCEEPMLRSIPPSQRSKLYVSGSPTILQMRKPDGTKPRGNRGLVCENLHSVRLNAAGNLKDDFMTIFSKYCGVLANEGRQVTMRPHPGGQYVLKQNISLPANVTLNNNPIYKVDLSKYAFGISAPSSVVMDMVLAGIPVAIWRDGVGVIDTGNYEGLTVISSLSDWLEFSREAVLNPESFIERQQRFIEKSKIIINPVDIYTRFAKLFKAITKINSSIDIERVMFIINGHIPTLQLGLVKPLTPLVQLGKLALQVLAETDMKEEFGSRARSDAVYNWLDKRLSHFSPTFLMFCRYSGPHAKYILRWGRMRNIPVIYNIDDDLLNVPVEIGVDKYEFHNHPFRRSTVRYLLDHADLIYCSNERLKHKLEKYNVTSPLIAGKIFCAGSIIVAASQRTVTKIGYMGFDHAHDLKMIVAAIVKFLQRNPDIKFELFGSIPRPMEMEVLGEQVSIIPPVRDYDEFLTSFAKLNWDIGICPLATSDFNMVKSNNKWVEYTSIGAAVIASRGTIYDECCADGCGILVNDDEEWLMALESLVKNPDERFLQVSRAQKKLTEQYSFQQLRDQITNVFQKARNYSSRNKCNLTVDIKKNRKERVIFIATEYSSELYLSFVVPLKLLVERGDMQIDILTVNQIKERTDEEKQQKTNQTWIKERLVKYDPTIIVFCGYNGPYADLITRWAKQALVPVIFHTDDNPFNFTPNVERDESTVRHLLENADLIYCSTERLKARLDSFDVMTRKVTGDITCSGRVLIPAKNNPVQKIGYMVAAGYSHNLSLVLPAILKVLSIFPTVKFELYGSIRKPLGLEEYGERIKTISPINNYEDFLREFANFGWDIGLCPLVPIDSNLTKANTNWVEYTSLGIAVVASKGTVYDECCDNGCGILAWSTQDWLTSIEMLINNPKERFNQVVRAQKKLIEKYSTEKLREQVLEIFGLAKALC